MREGLKKIYIMKPMSVLMYTRERERGVEGPSKLQLYTFVCVRF